MTLPPFKIRCSAIGQIMTNPRSKSETLSETAKTYAETWVKEQLYGRHKDFTSKYTDKGNSMEQAAIDFAAAQLGWGMVFKNEDYLSDEHITGTPDLIMGDLVADIKCPWDCFTFPLFDSEPPKGYDWQLQGYMALTGAKRAHLVYCLMDAPEHIIEREAWSRVRADGGDELTQELFEEVKEQMTYANIPDKYRIRTFELVADPDKVQAIRERVGAVREHIDRIWNK